ncbi:excalibur calcium-binding domain-containing protein [Amycolatopsis sp. H20-H5]|uniref:excalibur calcium-binding domain-containing protein n=1 Tax=Amycolatopsis sp. H20-H5 TaxID=3046309 RepID=UPI002DBE8A76|nr:excalibur calcium-binding domain-containing protein [Amycolatopsis sp. H20-H5]MEC3977951.1 excalibur calcium-binding domain-containing protein [Amycolatopsis sp. H20-H5]
MSLFRRVFVTAAVAAGFALAGPAPMVFAQVSAATDLNCSDFQYQEQAQAVLDSNPADPNHLDADKDGYACESRFGEPKKSGQVKVKPVGGVATGGGEPDSGNGVLLVAGASTAALASAGLVLLLRRRTS